MVINLIYVEEKDTYMYFGFIENKFINFTTLQFVKNTLIRHILLSAKGRAESGNPPPDIQGRNGWIVVDKTATQVLFVLIKAAPP